jgi:uncharacterized peroxidase-related enzyme
MHIAFGYLQTSSTQKEIIMARVQFIDPAHTTSNRKEILDQIHGTFGTTPNMFKAVANSPAALKSMWSSFGALGGGVLGAKLGEQIAVAVADRNRCEYCLAAHTALGKNAGVSAEAMASAQLGKSSDPKTAAALAFALKLVNARGQVTTDDIAAMRAAGFDDEHIVEVVAHVALNIFTNYVNIAFDVPVDFPKVKLLAAA